jgi:hypothetical protein
MAACVTTTGFLVNWFVAAGVLAVILIHAFRPFDFMSAYFLTVAGATFVYYEGGRMTRELTLLSGVILLMLVCYWVSMRGRLAAFPGTRLGWALLSYVLLSVANFGRGALSGHAPKFLFLDILPVLAVGTSFLVANAFDPKRDLRPLVVALTGLAYGSAAIGFWIFAVIHTRTAGVYFNATPAFVALLLMNLALRARTTRTAVLWVGLALPLFLHQFLSFRRGLWIGCLVGLFTTALIFAVGRGRRWARVGLVFGGLLGIGALGAVSLGLIYGQTDLLQLSAERFATIGETELRLETRANVARLLETATMLDLIQQSPWVGYGLGYTFILRNWLWGLRPPQWWADENYLLIWIKQGAIGLALYLWILWAAFRMGVRQARSRDEPWESSWFATLAAVMAFMAVFSLSDWPFGQVNPVFLLALLFGGSMAMASEGRLRLRWSP